MKKLFTILIIILSTSVIIAQVDKENVAVEIGTGTWCYYCPGAAMGADDMIANGLDVAIIENHNGDSYANNYSNARNSYYGITGYPTAFFDGVLSHVGGSHTQSLYATYLQKYNQRIDIPSDFTIDFEWSSFESTEFDILFNIEKVNGNYGDVKLHVAVTESEIPENWQGMHVLNFVNRVMLPDQAGTTLNFSSNDSQEVAVSFSIDPSWENEHCEMIAFLQNAQTKEVYQAVKINVMDMESDFAYDATFKDVYVTRTICSETVAPLVELKNYGQETLSSIDFVYSVNGGDPETYGWTGSLLHGESEFVQLPSVMFDLQEENTLNILGENPNGHDDEFPYNNEVERLIPLAKNVHSSITLQLNLDNHPEETSWEIRNSNGDVIYEGGGYSEPYATIDEVFDLDYNDCYSFAIFDEGGDGLTNGANYMIWDQSFVFFEMGDDFGYQDEVHFYMGLVDTKEITTDQIVNVFPNPFNSQFNVALNLSGSKEVKITLINSLGEAVYLQQQVFESGMNQATISSENLTEGIYFLILDIEGSIYKKKVILIK